MARAGLRVSVRELARLTGVSGLTVTRFENGNASCPDETVLIFRRILEEMGAEFTQAPQGKLGVTIAKPTS
jgi:Transcriptional regulators